MYIHLMHNWIWLTLIKGMCVYWIHAIIKAASVYKITILANIHRENRREGFYAPEKFISNSHLAIYQAVFIDNWFLYKAIHYFLYLPLLADCPQPLCYSIQSKYQSSRRSPVGTVLYRLISLSKRNSREFIKVTNLN